jgi:hypothetical protein
VKEWKVFRGQWTELQTRGRGDTGTRGIQLLTASPHLGISASSLAHRAGFTFVELLISLTLTTMLSFVLGAMILAAHEGWEHSSGLNDANQQARISQERIKYMVSQAGQYKIAGQPTTLGVAVVEQTYTFVKSPEILVVWSGGRLGGMAAQGVQARLPLVSEVVIYTPDADDPSRLVEVIDPADFSSLDFRAANFESRVKSILKSKTSQPILLVDRVRTSKLNGFSSNPPQVGNVRFEKLESPTDAELSGITPGTPEWFNLVWAQGIVSSASGMRQTSIRMEFQIEPRPIPLDGSDVTTTAIPYFASASYRYVYLP